VKVKSITKRKKITFLRVKNMPKKENSLRVMALITPQTVVEKNYCFDKLF
jgi:hypothetical protein